MDFKDIQNSHLDRDDVVFDSLLKSGNFANIYLAKLRSTNATVVAKTLKGIKKTNFKNFVIFNGRFLIILKHSTILQS